MRVIRNTMLCKLSGIDGFERGMDVLDGFDCLPVGDRLNFTLLKHKDCHARLSSNGHVTIVTNNVHESFELIDKFIDSLSVRFGRQFRVKTREICTVGFIEKITKKAKDIANTKSIDRCNSETFTLVQDLDGRYSARIFPDSKVFIFAETQEAVEEAAKLFEAVPSGDRP